MVRALARMEQALAFLGGVGGAVIGVVALIVLIGAVVLMRCAAAASSARRVDALAALLDRPFHAIRD